MIQLAINILWLLIGAICLLGVVWLAMYVVELFTFLDRNRNRMVWAIVLILILIAVLTLLAGGGARAPFHFSATDGGSYATAEYLPRMLT